MGGSKRLLLLVLDFRGKAGQKNGSGVALGAPPTNLPPCCQNKFFAFLRLILLEDIFYTTASSLGLILRKCTVCDRKYMATRKII